MKKIVIILFGALFLFSCNDFFEPVPKGNIPEKDFYKSLNNLGFALNGIYNDLQSTDYQLSELIFGEAMSDNSWNSQDVVINKVGQLLNFQFDTDNPYILTRYQKNYQIIYKCNQIIRSIPHVEYRINEGNEKYIREIYGQALLIRALSYFNLAKTFGGVSIMPTDQDLEHLIVKRSSLDDTYAYIEKDLRESLLLLRRNRYQLSEAGQAGIGAALGLLVKVLVYQASPGVKLENPNRAEKWQEALEICNFFVEGKDMTVNDLLKFDTRYTAESWTSLSKRLFLSSSVMPETVITGQEVVNIHQLDQFDRIFRVEGEFGPESLFEVNHFDYSSSGIPGDEGWQLSSCITVLGGTVNITPTSDLKDLFSNDPRGLFTLTDRNVNDYYKQEEQRPNIGPFDTGNGLIFTKYYVFPSEGSSKVRNYRIMRYAEVLLLYAEVLNETGDSRKAVDYLNKIRQRARKLLDPSNPNAKYNREVSINNFKDVEYAPYNIVRDAIRNEKRIEMAGEFDRWFELYRLGLLAERMAFIAKNPPVEPSGALRERGKYFRKGVNELFPIPQKEVQISNGVIEQNFGY